MRALPIAALTAALCIPSVVGAEPSPSKADKLICKTSKVTGSRISTERVCMTRKQWDELAYETQKKHVNTIDEGARINAPKG